MNNDNTITNYATGQNNVPVANITHFPSPN